MLAGRYHAGLVTLSVVVAAVAAYVALDLAARLTAASGRPRRTWLLGGALSMGGGIWAMHYLGMLAFTLAVPVRYDMATVLVSFVAAVAAAGLALVVVSRERLTTRLTAAASVVMGLGISAMHFIGMEAMRFAGHHAYEPDVVATAVGVAVAVSFVAMRLAFRFRTETRALAPGKLASAAVMGLAIAGMHYTGMAAATFHQGPTHPQFGRAVGVSTLGIFGLTAVTAMALGLAVVWSRLGLRLDRQAEAARASEERYRQLFSRSLAGVYQSTFDGRLLDCNDALARMLGYNHREEVLALTADDLYAAPDDRARWTAALAAERALPQYEHQLKRRDGRLLWVIESASLIDGADGGPPLIEGTIVDITARRDAERRLAETTSTLAASHERYRTLVETTNAVPWEIDATTRAVSYLSPQADRLFGYDVAAATGRPFRWDVLHDDDRPRVQRQVAALVAGPPGSHLETEYRLKTNHGTALVRSVIASALAPGGGVTLRGITFDITAQRQLELDLQQAQKLESIGRLAAGIAHEINTPVQFVNDSLHFVHDGVGRLRTLLAAYRAVAEAETPAALADARAAARRADAETDGGYVLGQLPDAIALSLDGLERVTRIVRSMKEFAHADSGTMTSVDLNRAIESTLTVARHEYRYVADVDIDFGVLPPVTCHAGEVNQAILNILVNAAHAIADRVRGTGERGRITVRTRREDDHVLVSIADTGGGIPEALGARVFEPFFTTKGVGRGTGQGLAIARAVVVEKHGGDLRFDTTPGEGTTFHLRLPLAGRAAPAAAA
jgi:two-component system NtrC family sensor kinase